ncbi:MAG: LysE family transporter [Muribaculaceae bacterium]|nr:LysE family transporter [Muribaculaceae bacterium]MDE5929137.1 LysE family transporter [Muribaculaceae bacterium]MDE6130573.1 LysE family transporter [Muribaculaceae bacterium]
MHEFLYILPRGLAIGALISAPMGPIGMLVIQRTLSKGRWPGFFTGVGAGLSDVLYCLLTGFCMSFVTGFIDANKLAIQLIGSVVLAVFGLFLFRKNPTRQLKSAEVAASDYWSDFITGFLLTFSNPLILFFIIGLYARFSFILPDYGIHHYIWAYLTILGGAVLWWYAVTYLVNKLRRRFNVRALWLVNRIVGLVLIAMAAIGAAMCFV